MRIRYVNKQLRWSGGRVAQHPCFHKQYRIRCLCSFIRKACKSLRKCLKVPNKANKHWKAKCTNEATGAFAHLTLPGVRSSSQNLWRPPGQPGAISKLPLLRLSLSVRNSSLLSFVMRLRDLGWKAYSTSVGPNTRNKSRCGLARCWGMQDGDPWTWSEQLVCKGKAHCKPNGSSLQPSPLPSA